MNIDTSWYPTCAEGWSGVSQRGRDGGERWRTEATVLSADLIRLAAQRHKDTKTKRHKDTKTQRQSCQQTSSFHQVGSKTQRLSIPTAGCVIGMGNIADMSWSTVKNVRCFQERMKIAAINRLSAGWWKQSLRDLAVADLNMFWCRPPTHRPLLYSWNKGAKEWTLGKMRQHR